MINIDSEQSVRWANSVTFRTEKKGVNSAKSCEEFLQQVEFLVTRNVLMAPENGLSFSYSFSPVQIQALASNVNLQKTSVQGCGHVRRMLITPPNRWGPTMPQKKFFSGRIRGTLLFQELYFLAIEKNSENMRGRAE